MQRVTHRLAILASVVVLAASTMNCSRSGDSGSSSSILGPSESAAARGNGRGGNKPGGGGGTLGLVTVNDATGNGAPTWGDTVTFNWSTSATTQPVIELTCRQSGVIVLSTNAGFYDSYPWPWERNMTLKSSMWQSGAADCTAILFPLGDRSNVLATLNFYVGA